MDWGRRLVAIAPVNAVNASRAQQRNVGARIFILSA